MDYLKYLCIGDLSNFLCLFIQSCIYISMHSWIFILYLDYNPILFYIFCCLTVLVLAIGYSFRWLLSPFGIPSVLCFFLFPFKALPFFQDRRCSRIILHIPYPALESPFSARNVGSFDCKMLLETKIWILDTVTVLVYFVSQPII